MENWKPVLGFEGLYEVSDLGQIKSLLFNKSRILKPSKRDYLQVTLSGFGGKRYERIHRLVAQAFIPNPEKLRTVNHKDEDKHNNKLDNLEWMSDPNQQTFNSEKISLTHSEKGTISFSNISEFCREQSIDRGNINKVILRKLKSSKGWSISEESY